MPSKRQVKLVPMYADDIDRLYRISESIGLPFRRLLSEIVEKGASLYLASKGDLEGVKNIYNAINNIGSLGFLLIPTSIANKLLQENSKLEDLLKEAVTIGEAIGNVYLLNNYTSTGEIAGLLRLLFLDASQLNVSEGDGELRITINAPGRSRPLINLSLKFLDAFFRSLNYSKSMERVNGGLIILVYKRG